MWEEDEENRYIEKNADKYPETSNYFTIFFQFDGANQANL